MTLPSVAAVVDTNVLISALIGKPGPPVEILKAFAARQFLLVTSEPLLDELEIVTLRPEISKRLSAVDTVAFWSAIRDGAMSVIPVSRPMFTPDPSDHLLFTTALAARAQYVVTGDQALLNLKEIEGVRVLSPRAFLTWLER